MPRPSNPTPMTARLSGSGTAEADTSPVKLEVNAPRVVPSMCNAGPRLANVRLKLDGSSRSLAGMTLGVSASVSGGLLTWTTSPAPPLAPNAASVNVPDRKLPPQPAIDETQNDPL